MSTEVAFTALLLVALGACLGSLGTRWIADQTLSEPEFGPEDAPRAFFSVFLVGVFIGLLQTIYLGFQFKNGWSGNEILPVFLYVPALAYVCFVALITFGLGGPQMSLAAYLGHLFVSAGLVIMGSACMFVVFGLEEVNNGKMIETAEALYFSAVSFSTLGFGDIKPTEGVSRLIAALEAIIGNIHLALFAAGAFTIMKQE